MSQTAYQEALMIIDREIDTLKSNWKDELCDRYLQWLENARETIRNAAVSMERDQETMEQIQQLLENAEGGGASSSSSPHGTLGGGFSFDVDGDSIKTKRL